MSDSLRVPPTGAACMNAVDRAHSAGLLRGMLIRAGLSQQQSKTQAAATRASKDKDSGCTFDGSAGGSADAIPGLRPVLHGAVQKVCAGLNSSNTGCGLESGMSISQAWQRERSKGHRSCREPGSRSAKHVTARTAPRIYTR